MDLETKRRNVEKLRRELGYSIINLLSDFSVVEIILNPDGGLWVERVGKPLEQFGNMDPAAAEAMMGTVASIVGTVVTSKDPILECQLPIDGSRFEGLLPPIVKNPCFAIRKRANKIFTLEDYLDSGSLNRVQFEIIDRATRQRKNIVVVGSTGSGKTTLTNAILNQTVVNSPTDRILIIEDTPEIQCAAKNNVIMNTSSVIDMNRLLKASLRLRPDRIVVGEVRGGEALSLLKAWNTGHPGGVATVHANSGYAGLIRLEQLIGEVSEKPMQNLIAEAVNIIVFIERTKSGRKISEILSVGEFKDGKYSVTNLC